MKFEWDENKNQQNIKKHGVSFEEAETAFYDIYSVLLYDDEHSGDEDRFILIGEDSIFRRLIVCHCYRGVNSEITRIISARKANKHEIKRYEKGLLI